MSDTNLQTLTIVKKAAELKASGLTWAAIAPLIGRGSEASAKNLTQEHPELWVKYYVKAIQAILSTDAYQEALLTQRQLLRSADERVKQAAAHSIMANAAKLWAQKIELTAAGGQPLEVMLQWANGNGNGDSSTG